MRVHPDGFPDELIPEAAFPVQHLSGADLSAWYAWDASDAVRRGVVADADRPPARLVGVDVEKSVDLEQDGPERDALLPLRFLVALRAQPDAAALCKPDEARSAAQSCVAQASAAQMTSAEPQDAQAQRA